MSEVNVPEWVSEIEARLAPFPPMFFQKDDEGKTAHITITPLAHGLLGEYGEAISAVLQPAIQDLSRLCREVRDLLAIVSDLKEERGVVYMATFLESMYRLGVFHSRAEAEKFAEKEAEEYGSAVLVSEWTGRESKDVSLWGPKGKLCLACEGDGLGRKLEKCSKCAGKGVG